MRRASVTPVTHTRPSPQSDSRSSTPENDGLSDELFGGVVEMRIVVVAIDADKGVRELVTDDVDLRVDRLP